jgi:hypothetical protein
VKRLQTDTEESVLWRHALSSCRVCRGELSLRTTPKFGHGQAATEGIATLTHSSDPRSGTRTARPVACSERPSRPQ